MAVTIESVACLVLVALIWGITNPLIKKGSKGLDSVKATTPWGQFAKEIVFLVTTVKYIVPFLLNQTGSVLYFLTLQNTDLSLAVPVSNSLTFVFTAIAGWFLGEERSHINTYIGMILILTGTTLCCLDKVEGMDELHESFN